MSKWLKVFFLSAKNRNWIPWILLLLGSITFAVFCFPNAAGSVDSKMVLIFQPDEAVPLPYVLDMIKPAETLKQALINFAFYEYYFYGFPYFAISALVLLPVQWAGQIQNTPFVMLLLRQLISVLPMLAAIGVILYLQTRFRSYKAILIFLCLVSLPAVTYNNFWWHPDGLAILFSMLALTCLSVDDLRLGRYFYFAAALCGIAAMTKGIGFFFFLAVILVLILALWVRKTSILKVVLSALVFLGIMALAYFASNPILIYAGARERFFGVMSTQSEFLTQGYEIVYAKGFLASLPELISNFGSWPFLLAAVLACFWGIWRGPNRLTHALIFAWAIPLSVMAFVIIHFKFQYWMPVALPLISCLVVFLPDREDFRQIFSRKKTGQASSGTWLMLKMGILVLVIVQVISFTQRNLETLIHQTARAEHHEAIQFYDQALKALEALPEQDFYVYHDVRMYVPESSPWVTESIFEMLNYEFIDQRNYNIVMLMQERLYDYLNPKVEGIDPDKLKEARRFYQDAEDETLQGYRLVYRDSFGLVYLRDTLYDTYFNSTKTP